MHTLLSRLLDDPDDEPTWLVLADWLEEQGDVRAAMIRRDIALSTAQRRGDRALVHHLSREQQAQNEAQRARLGPVLASLPQVQEVWHGGFLVGLRGWRHGLPRDARAVGAIFEESGHPLLRALQIAAPGPEALIQWLDQPGFSRLQRLDIDMGSHQTWGAQFTSELLRLDALEGLQELGLRPGDSLDHGLWGGETFEALLNEVAQRDLQRLDLGGNRHFGRHGTAALARATHLSLRTLILRGTELRHASAHALLSSDVIRPVRQLDLSDNRVGARGIEAFVESPHLERLEVLSLAHCGLTDGQVRRLTAARMPRLRQLDLRGNRLTSAVSSFPASVDVVGGSTPLASSRTG